MLSQNFTAGGLFYLQYGEGSDECIILIHGIGADHAMFHLQVDPLVSHGFRVVIPDMRGHGKSPRAKSLSLNDWIKDLVELMDHLGIDKCNILGVSMGGVIAMEFACQHPTRVRRLIVSDSFGKLGSAFEKIVGWGQVVGFNLFHYLPSSWAARLVSSTYKRLTPDAETYFREVTQQADFRQLVLARKAINKVDVLPRLAALELPSLVIVGNKVKFMVGINRKIASSLKGSEFHVISGAMDPSNLVASREFNRIILGFLNEN
jgi:3-oxoadipate enol-lactonase